MHVACLSSMKALHKSKSQPMIETFLSTSPNEFQKETPDECQLTSTWREDSWPAEVISSRGEAHYIKKYITRVFCVNRQNSAQYLIR